MWEIELGPLRLAVEHRNAAPGGGPTLRVRERAGRELLRFDCFLEGGHWHRDPEGRDEIRPIDSPEDPIDATSPATRRARALRRRCPRAPRRL
jgi:hypothetical protein